MVGQCLRELGHRTCVCRCSFLSTHLPFSASPAPSRLFLSPYRYLFLERGEVEGKEKEKHQCVVASLAPPTGDLACNLGMCPDWELNW